MSTLCLMYLSVDKLYNGATLVNKSTGQENFTMASVKSLIGTRKKKTVRSAPRVKLGSKLQEPDWTGAEAWDGEKFHNFRRAASTFYYEHFKPAELYTHLFEWMKRNGYSKVDIQKARTAPTGRMSIVASYIARMLNLGMPDVHPAWNEHWESLAGTQGTLKPASDFVKKNIDELVEVGTGIEQEKKKEDKANANVYVPTIQEKMREASVAMAEEIDTTVEEWIRDRKTLDVKNFAPLSMLRKAQAKANHARLIRKFYEPEYDEFAELLGPKRKGDDLYDQLIEGYSHLSTAEKKQSLEVYKKIVDACDIIIGEQKLNKKPRKVKEKSADKLVEKLKFKASDTAYGIVSVKPTDIVGAEYVVIFNTKNRKVGYYQASNMDPRGLGRGGLGVKGTTIEGFKEENSLQKTLRKPNEQLALFTSTKTKALKEFKSINATETKLNGRMNEHCVILKVFK